MCNCGTSSNYKLTIKGCGKKVETLTKLKNKMVTLYNISDNGIKKEEYKEFMTEIDIILKTYYLNKTCPELKIVSNIQQQVENEYSKHNN